MATEVRADPPTLALTAEQRALVMQIVHSTLPGAEVYAFGSRTTGRARPHSDLDLLVVRPPALSLSQRAALRDSFEACDLPFKVDVIEQAALTGLTAQRVARERIRL